MQYPQERFVWYVYNSEREIPPPHPYPPSSGYVMKDFKEYLGVSERCKRKEPFLIELFARSECTTQGKNSIVGEVS